MTAPADLTIPNRSSPERGEDTATHGVPDNDSLVLTTTRTPQPKGIVGIWCPLSFGGHRWKSVGPDPSPFRSEPLGGSHLADLMACALCVPTMRAGYG